jgi:hypothetical protein
MSFNSDSDSCSELFAQQVKIFVVPESVETLTPALMKDRSIDSVDFGKVSRVQLIDDFTFQECRYLKYVCLPACVELIGKSCFAESGLVLLTFERGSKLSAIQEGAFRKCFSLESFCFPSRIHEIKDSAFEFCSQLRSVTFETNSELNVIGTGAS